MGTDVITVRQGKDKKWYWHRQSAGNYEVISSGEGYNRLAGALYGVGRANRDFGGYVLKIFKKDEEILVPAGEVAAYLDFETPDGPVTVTPVDEPAISATPDAPVYDA